MDVENAEEAPRAKRQKRDKEGRFAALQRLKELKGNKSKNKYEIDDVQNVYDIVDEAEYTKRIVSRQEDDWIEDDGTGYVEDGREIFDDDLDAESIAKAGSSKGRGSKRKKKNVSEHAGKGNLQYMLSNMPAKKKEDAKLEDDDILSELISEIDNGNENSNAEQGFKLKNKPKQRFSLMTEKKAVQDYMKSFKISKPKAPEPVDAEPEDESYDTMDCEDTNETSEVLQEITPSDNQNQNVAPAKKLLFTVTEKKKPSIEQTASKELENLSTLDFEDDFDLDQLDSVGTSALNESTKECLLEHNEVTFNAVENETLNGLDELDMTEIAAAFDDSVGFKFYWWDAYEDEKNQPGVVLLFGKTYSEEEKRFISCTVVIKNIPRKIYLLPRPFFLDKTGEETDQPVSIMDVYQEFNNSVAKRFNIPSYKSKKVLKKYAFDSSIPEESEYLEVRYEGKYDFQEQTNKTFSKIFGMNSSFLELFLLERQIKGPCWLEVKNYEKSSNPYTHSDLELRCDKTTDITVIRPDKPLPPPPLTVLALNIKTAVNPKKKFNEIAMISVLVNKRYCVDKQIPNPPFQEHFCAFTKLSECSLPTDLYAALSKYKATKVQKLDSEKALLNYFLAQFSRIDPDLIVGHDMNGYQLSILAERLHALNPTNYSRLSRIKRPNGKLLYERQIFSGRLVSDIKVSAKELKRCRAYDLDTLCQAILKVPEGQRIEIESENIPKIYESSAELLRFVTITMQDTSYILKIMFELNVIPLALQITNIAGNVMSRTLLGGRSERNEFLLLHAFNERDYIVPEKQFKKKTVEDASASRRKKPTYSGGLVLDPKVGFYDKLILLMDFNSLYPSIIQEYNICFTTIATNNDDSEEYEIQLPDKDVPMGILPTEIRKLVESRREVKKLMKNADLSPDLRMQYDIRQMALKLTANSMYGCLGFSNSRFFAKKLASLVTQKGREILTSTKDIVQKLCYDVIYGDTDSIMINTNITDYEQVFKIGKSIKQEINQMYKQVELDIDGVFKYLLLLKKKKYAAVNLTKDKHGKLVETQEHKGLDIVRRDWSQIAATAGKFVLNQILCSQSNDDRIENIYNYLRQLKEHLDNGKTPLQLLEITKQLTKDPSQYPDKNSLPHVQVALRNNKTKGKKFRAGDTVSYIVCKDGTNNSATLRAYLLEELKSRSDLQVDCEYYMSQQVYPVVSRICEPLESIDSHEIGNCLGVEVRHVSKPGETVTSALDSIQDFQKLELKFQNCEPFMFKCISCGYFNTSSGNEECILEQCGNAECPVRPVDYVAYIKNQMVLALRRFEKKYYSDELKCEDPVCTAKTQRIWQRFQGDYPVCVVCNRNVMYKVHNEESLYLQIKYFQKLFDASDKKKRNLDAALDAGYQAVKKVIDRFLSNCGYGIVDLGDLLSIFQINSAKVHLNEAEIDATQVFEDEEPEED